MKIVRTLFRLLVGFIFIFSGLVKGIDPMGTVYRMDDYFIAFGTTWASPFSPYLTILLCTIEFAIGISLFFNLWIKGTAWLLLPMMTFFTILTFFDAVYNLVPDCGCFGDAIKLTNVQTFIKNLILMVFVVPIFLWRKNYKPASGFGLQISILLAFFLGFGGMTVYAYRHLPIVDFMPWKVGNTVLKENKEPVRFYVTYKNRNTGETKEYLAPNYPWNDSVWMSQWVFISQRQANVSQEDLMTLRIEDEAGNDVTQIFAGIPDYHFFFISYDLTKASEETLLKANHLAYIASEEGYSFIGITSTLSHDVKIIKDKYKLEIPFYFADDVVLKSMIRSNPGLVLIHKGIVTRKWAWRDFPSFDEAIKPSERQ